MPRIRGLLVVMPLQVFAMNNIDVFNIAVGEIFRECFTSFPMPVSISKSGIGKNVVEIYRGYEHDFYDQDDEEYKIAHHTIIWLARAGYIWLQKEADETDRVFEAVLSPKGLEVLNATPKSLTGSGSIGQRLSKGAKDIGADVFKSLSVQALSYGAKMAINGGWA